LKSDEITVPGLKEKKGLKAKLCPNCAKNIERSQKIHQNIKKYRNPESPVFRGFTGEIPYIFCFLPLLRNLHTVEVAGRNPVLPAIFLPRMGVGRRRTRNISLRFCGLLSLEKNPSTYFC
jgi:predicted RNA-binding Zn-ribbon protein involved in translation (DUF1610 family)